jgi:hypothetical protein
MEDARGSVTTGKKCLAGNENLTRGSFAAKWRVGQGVSMRDALRLQQPCEL